MKAAAADWGRSIFPLPLTNAAKYPRGLLASTGTKIRGSLGSRGKIFFEFVERGRSYYAIVDSFILEFASQTSESQSTTRIALSYSEWTLKSHGYTSRSVAPSSGKTKRKYYCNCSVTRAASTRWNIRRDRGALLALLDTDCSETESSVRYDSNKNSYANRYATSFTS